MDLFQKEGVELTVLWQAMIIDGDGLEDNLLLNNKETKSFLI